MFSTAPSPSMATLTTFFSDRCFALNITLNTNDIQYQNQMISPTYNTTAEAAETLQLTLHITVGSRVLGLHDDR